MSDLDLRTDRVLDSDTTTQPVTDDAGSGVVRRRGAVLAWLRAILPAAVAAAATVSFFEILTGFRHIRVPVGADAYWYVQALRTVGRYGLSIPHMLARPAYPLVASTLGQVVGASSWTTTVVVTTVMTAGLGLAGGAIIARWHLRPWWLALAVFLVGTSVTSARLLGGKSENFMNVWLLAAALAVALWSGSRRGAVGAGALAFGAGLAEWPFLAAFLVLLGVALVLWEVLPWSPAVRRRRALRGSGTTARPFSGAWSRSWAGTVSLRMLFIACAAAAVLVALVVVVWNRTGPSDAVALTPEPAGQYLVGLRSQLSFEWPWLVGPLVVIGWFAARRFGNPRIQPVRWFLGVWTIVIALTIVVGFTGVALPAYRALTFDLPIALAAAGAAFLPLAMLRTARARSRRVGLRAAAAVLAVLSVVPAFTMWGHTFRPNTNPYQLAEIRTASQYSLGLGGRPVILVIGRTNPVATYFLQKEVISAIGGGGGRRVLVFVGHAADVLHGQPSTWGSPAYNSFARMLFQPVLQAYRKGAPILIGRALDPQEWPWAASITPRSIGPDLVILRGPWPRPKTTSPGRFFPLPHWYTQIGMALVMLLILWLCGAGWSRLALPEAPAQIRATVAPAFGATGIAVTTLLAGRLAHHLGGWPGALGLAAALAASAAAALADRRRRRLAPATADG